MAAACQSIAVVIAVIAGGIWTVYTFTRLRTINKAEIKLEELKKKQAGEVNLAVTIKVERCSRSYFSPNKFGLLITATLTNKGTIPASIDFTQAPFVAMQLGRGDDEHPKVVTTTSTYYYSIVPDPDLLVVTYITCYPEIETVIRGYLEVPEAGLYLVAFTTYKGRLEELDRREIKGIKPAEAEWKTHNMNIRWIDKATISSEILLEIAPAVLLGQR